MASGNSPRIYVISTDTASGVFNSDALWVEIVAAGIPTTLTRIRSGEGNLELYGSTPWPTDEHAALDGVVLAHTGVSLDQALEASATVSTQTTASSDVLMDGMSLVPGAGTYVARFSTSVENSKNNSKTYVSLYMGGTQVGHTQRHSRRGGGQGSVQDIITTHARVTTTDGDAIEIRWRVTSGTATAHERTLLLQRED